MADYNNRRRLSSYSGTLAYTKQNYRPRSTTSSDLDLSGYTGSSGNIVDSAISSFSTLMDDVKNAAGSKLSGMQNLLFQNNKNQRYEAARNYYRYKYGGKSKFHGDVRSSESQVSQSSLGGFESNQDTIQTGRRRTGGSLASDRGYHSYHDICLEETVDDSEGTVICSMLTRDKPGSGQADGKFGSRDKVSLDQIENKNENLQRKSAESVGGTYLSNTNPPISTANLPDMTNPCLNRPFVHVRVLYTDISKTLKIMVEKVTGFTESRKRTQTKYVMKISLKLDDQHVTTKTKTSRSRTEIHVGQYMCLRNCNFDDRSILYLSFRLYVKACMFSCAQCLCIGEASVVVDHSDAATCSMLTIPLGIDS